MTYNPQYHHRRSIRLKGYDYSQAGLYFITICVNDRSCLFGNITNKEMILNDAGKMFERWYYELENKYPDKRCHEMIVMPNHFHCIIENQSDFAPEVLHNIEWSDSKYGQHNKKINASISDAMDWLKTMTTNEYIRGVKTLGWQRFNGKFLQRDYFEHIIRDVTDYERISNYIIDNPARWDEDKFFNP